jgi:mannonate dehydratase
MRWTQVEGSYFYMASTNVGVQEMPHRPGSFAADIFPKQIGWEDGFAYAPDAPGLGVDFDEGVAEERRVPPIGWPPLLRRDDGAFTNW